MKHPPTAVHFPPSNYLSVIEPEHDSDPRLGLVLSAVRVREATPECDVPTFEDTTPRFTTDYLFRLNELTIRSEASIILDEKNHNIDVYRNYVAYCTTIGIGPRPIEEWHGYSPYPGANRDAQQPAKDLPVETLLHEVGKPKPNSGSHFPVMAVVDVGVRDTASCDPKDSYKVARKEIRITRVVDSVENFTGHYSPRTRRQLRIRGRFVWVYLAATPLLKLVRSTLNPITEPCEQEPACLKRIAPRPVTFDRHVATAGYRRTINNKGVTKQLSVEANTGTKRWCKTCDTYVEQAHACPITFDAHVAHWFYYKTKRGEQIALLMEYSAIREREEVRLKRVASFESLTADRRTQHSVAWVKSFAFLFSSMSRPTPLLPATTYTEPLWNWKGCCWCNPGCVHESPRHVDYLSVVDPSTCTHVLAKAFTFSTGQTIKMCPDCATFDEHRRQVLRQGYVFKSSPTQETRWDISLKKENLSFERAAVHPELLWDVERAAAQEHGLSELFSLSNSEHHEQAWRAGEQQARKDRRADAVANKKRPERYVPPVSSTASASCWYCHGGIKGKRKGTKYCSKACCNNGAELRQRIK
jgi:hypothetical protein